MDLNSDADLKEAKNISDMAVENDNQLSRLNENNRVNSDDKAVDDFNMFNQQPSANGLSTIISSDSGMVGVADLQAAFERFKENRSDSSSVNGTTQSVGGVTENKNGESPWYDVGIFKGTSCIVKNYYESNGTNEHENLNIDNLPDFASRLKHDLEPGTAYKVRMAAINSCGRSEWSDPSAFKTYFPGYPAIPFGIKIIKFAEGAHLSWQPPSASSGNILEYSVCLAVKKSIASAAQTDGKVPGVGTSSQLAFFRVYCGPQNQCVVSSFSLTAAHIDTRAKPAIIFRIAAKNDKGYGPATQVRWLQDTPTKTAQQLPPAKRDNTPPSAQRSQKKYRIENF